MKNLRLGFMFGMGFLIAIPFEYYFQRKAEKQRQSNLEVSQAPLSKDDLEFATYVKELQSSTDEKSLD